MRPWQIWLAYCSSLLVACAALGWLTAKALEADRAERHARDQALFEENARLALWRMDSALAQLVSQESAWPPLAYQSFASAGQISGNRLARRTQDEPLIASPLLRRTSPLVVVHFQFDRQDRLTSPQVPAQGQSESALDEPITAAELAQARAGLGRVAKLVTRRQLLSSLPVGAEAAGPLALGPPSPNMRNSVEVALAEEPQPGAQPLQQRSAKEYLARQQLVARNSAAAQFANAANFVPSVEPKIHAAPMTPLWVRGELLLARRVLVGGRHDVQGCLLDWPQMKRQLLASIRDLLPAAELAPAGSAAQEPRRLAALPVRLVPGAATATVEAGLTPIELALALAWGSMALVAAAVALLLGGVLTLSERRAAFVSAVTHELRTPLTTFRMYAEMLADGMVADGPRRREYLQTLCAEAHRLTHLVENVLAYARLQRGAAPRRAGKVSVERLLRDELTARLAERARQAGLELSLAVEPGAGKAEVLADPAAVEQILFNLVDNASKYAAGGADRRLHLEATLQGRRVLFRVRDHGPGIRGAERRRLFRPFHKSADEAAHSAPGVGLGLALCRRLARDMSGQLELAPSDSPGACFVLALPRAAGGRRSSGRT